MKTAEPFSYKPPMTAIRSGIKYENGEAIFIGKGGFQAITTPLSFNAVGTLP